MNKTLFVFLFLVLNTVLSIAQVGQANDDYKLVVPYCASHEVEQNLITNSVQYKKRSQAVDSIILLNSNLSLKSLSSVSSDLPIVVHVIHQNGNENVSDAQIIQAVADLNQAFGNQGYYNPTTGVNTEIAFCLAQQDPNGNVTTGITRTVSTLTNVTIETQDLQLKDLMRWDPEAYINIWLVKSITSTSSGPGVAGYAYLPSAHGMPMDGIVNEAQFFGSTPANSAIHVHEMGHYLGLRHTFEGGCKNDNCQTDGDRICDTPPDQSTTAVPCGNLVNSCTTDEDDTSTNNPFRSSLNGGIGDQSDNYENYMDYGDRNCYSMFTQGQSDRMCSVINNVRSSLLDFNKCAPACMDPIVASFNTSTGVTVFNQGATVSFVNSTVNGLNFEWFIIGTSFSMITNPQYTFNDQGFFTISLEVTNNDENCWEQYELQIQIICPTNPCAEICNNSIDDDGDGLIDCLDIDCECEDICNSKGESNNWFFGNNAGMTFNGGGTPVALSGSSMSTSEGVSTISDAMGNLLFYSDGRSIWDADHNTMPNGTGMGGSNISAQSSIIIKQPESNFLYYVFTVPDWTQSTTNLQYSIVDMSLNGGKGEVLVASKNTVINNIVAERVTAALHENCKDIWIVSHERGNTNFVAYLLTDMGVDPSPVVSSVGEMTHGGNRYGALKFSHDGLSISSTLGGTSIFATVALYGFDYATGIVSNERVLATGGEMTHAYSSEFSADNSFLYVSSFNGPQVWQYDLNLLTLNDIVNSKTNVVPSNAPNSTRGCMQMGPDNKIYIAKRGQASMDVISFPNGKGAASAFVGNIVNVGGTCGIGLPNFVPFYFKEELEIQAPDSLCFNEVRNIKINTVECETAIYTWEVIGDAIIVNNNVIDIDLKAGTTGSVVEVIVHKENSCGIESDTAQIVLHLCCEGPVIPLDLGPDIVQCEGDVSPLDAGEGYAYYGWQDGSNESIYTAYGPGIYDVLVDDGCGNIQRDTVQIEVDSTQSISIRDTIICAGEKLVLTIDDYDVLQWIPNDGSIDCIDCATVVIDPQQDSIYSVIGTTMEGCVSVDSFRVDIIDTTVTREELSLCGNSEILIFGTLESTPGEYSMTFTRPNACDSTHIITLSSVDGLIVDVLVQSISCYNETNGSIQLDVSGGDGNYTYLWNDPAFMNMSTITDLDAGAYSVTVTDGNNCDYSTFILLEEPNELVLTIDNIVNVLCGGVENGSIELSISGGTMPYQYDWDNNGIGDIDDPEDLYGLSAGVYSLTVVDASGCYLDFTQILDNSDTILTFETIEICEGESAIIFDNLESTADVYSQNYTTNDDCDSIHSILLVVNDGIDTSVEVSDVSCNGLMDGSIVIETSGGEGNYTYSWSNDENLNVSSQLELLSGNYFVTITDGNNCIYIVDQWIQQPDSLIIKLDSIVDVTCFSELDGSVSVQVTGGTPSYSYDWNIDGVGDFDDNPNLSNLGSGTYTLEVIDANGCVDVIDIAIEEPQSLTAELLLQNNLCDDDLFAEVSIIASGGSSPYLYNINDGGYADSSIFPNLTLGTYEFSVLDSNGCELNLEEAVEIDYLEISIDQPTIDQIYVGDSVALILNATPTPDSIVWSNASTLSCDNCLNPEASPLNNTNYTAILFYGECTRSVIISVLVAEQDIYVPNIFSPNGDGINDLFSIISSGGDVNINLFHIYDRWGEPIFSRNNFLTNDSSFGWDGTFNGQDVVSGVYVYYIEAVDPRSGTIDIAGDVTVVK